MNDKLFDALNEVREDQLMEAIRPPKRRYRKLIAAVAAVLALVILAGTLMYPGGNPLAQINGTAAGGIHQERPTGNVPVSSWPNSTGSEPSMPTSIPEPEDPPAYLCNVISLANVSKHVPTRAPELAAQLKSFFAKSMVTTLTRDKGTNKSYSPVNLYLALSTLAELSGGEEQLMGLLGAYSLDMLRTYASQLWNATRFYEEEKDVISLANSLWLEEGLRYNQQIMDTLAQTYFTDSFYGDLGSEGVNRQIASWLDHHTGNLLQEQTKNIQLDLSTVLALYSTIYYKVQWRDPFMEKNNFEGTFWGTEKTSVTFLCKRDDMTVYRGSNFTAVCNPLKTGGMWLILPDEGWTPEEIANSEEYLDMVLGLKILESEYCQVTLSMPKFDIQTNSSVMEDLHVLGISNIFNSETNSFAEFIQTDMDGGVCVSQINQVTRVCVDEWGVTAANYIEMPLPGDGVPPEKNVEFLLDRPFLYVITNKDNLPLFAGIVNDLS